MSYKAWNAGTCIVCSEPYKKGTQIESCKHEGTIFGYRHPSCTFVPPTFEPDPNFKPSQEQATIFSSLMKISMGFGDKKYEAEHLMVEANAGTGKTRTLQEAVYILAPVFQAATYRKPKILYLTFSKELAEEAKWKMDPRYCDVSTFHSWGFSLLKKTQKRRVHYNKLSEILDAHLPNPRDKSVSKEERKERRRVFSAYRKLIPGMKNTGLGAEDAMHRFQLELFTDELKYAGPILEQCQSDNSRVDFDDMIYLALVEEASTYGYDFIFVDEVQDLNPVMIDTLRLSVNNRVSCAFIGDPKQAIYRFRGGEAKMMQDLKEQYKAKTTKLTATYRCPLRIVELIKMQGHVKGFVAAPGAKLGEVYRRSMAGLPEDITEINSVLCRFNAPLLALAFKLIGLGKKAQVKGKQIGDNLKKFLLGLGAKSLDQLDSKLVSHYNFEQSRLEKINARNKQEVLETLEEKIECIRTIMSNSDSIEGLIEHIEKLFADNVVGILLCSIHKSKGLTLSDVILLGYDELPRPTKDPDDYEQEKNLLYVACSRVSNSLTLVYKNGYTGPSLEDQRVVQRAHLVDETADYGDWEPEPEPEPEPESESEKLRKCSEWCIGGCDSPSIYWDHDGHGFCGSCYEMDCEKCDYGTCYAPDEFGRPVCQRCMNIRLEGPEPDHDPEPEAPICQVCGVPTVCQGTGGEFLCIPCAAGPTPKNWIYKPKVAKALRNKMKKGMTFSQVCVKHSLNPIEMRWQLEQEG